ncbi:hypothetical protein BTR23_13405 [Alkalihalophilus pseudofirmus]|nr:hypothetical protein BTR23_13405 [Alkalihalophilus pseudofirmus]
MERILKNKVTSVIVHVSNLKYSAEWYSKLLGLEVLEDRFNGGPVYWMELEDYTGLILDDVHCANMNSGGWSKENAPLFMYCADSVPHAYNNLKELGINITLKIETPREGLSFFNFEDIDGNVFMVCNAEDPSPPLEKVVATPVHNSIPAVFVNVRDLQKAAEWHLKLLGLEQCKLSPNETIVEIQSEQGADIILNNNRYIKGDNYKVLFMFETEDINEAYCFVQSEKIAVYTEIKRYKDVSFFTILDPDDHVIMIGQSHQLSE